MAVKCKPKVGPNRCRSMVTAVMVLVATVTLIYLGFKLWLILTAYEKEAKGRYFVTNYVSYILGIGDGLTEGSNVWHSLTSAVTYTILLEHVKQDLQGLCKTAGELFRQLKNNFELVTILLLSVLLCGAFLSVFCFHSMYRKGKKMDSGNTRNNRPLRARQELYSNGRVLGHSDSVNSTLPKQHDTSQLNSRTMFKMTTIVVFVSFLLTVPFEFLRLYQTAIATKVAQMHPGVPNECNPNKMSIGQTFRSWLSWHFSWDNSDPCLEYHKALLVDPVLEVPPLLVLTSTLARCIVIPFETVTGGMGRSLRTFFKEIPTQWQPVIFLVMILLTVLFLVMKYGYRVHLPFLLKFEPKTPTQVKIQERRKETCCDSLCANREQQKLSLEDSHSVSS